MAGNWERDPQYSHGYMVPIIALVLLWYRHEQLEMGRPRNLKSGWGLLLAGIAAFFILPQSILAIWGFLAVGIAVVGAGLLLAPEEFQPAEFRPTWWGLPVLLIGVGLRVFAGYFYIEWFDRLSLIPVLTGLVLLTVGWRGFRWGWPAVLFVIFMIPLPHSLEGILRDPLRLVGTKASTYLMQTCSLPAFADGNRNEIIVGGMTQKIGVNEACSGLSMLIIFFALSTAVAVVMQRTVWEKILVVASAVPIAVIANVLRITITGMMLYWLQDEDVYLGIGNLVLVDMTGTQFASSFFHDWAGWMMMPLALGLLWLELFLLKRIIVVEQDAPVTIAISDRTIERPADAEADNSTKPEGSRDAQSASKGRSVPAALGEK